MSYHPRGYGGDRGRGSYQRPSGRGRGGRGWISAATSLPGDLNIMSGLVPNPIHTLSRPQGSEGEQVGAPFATTRTKVMKVENLTYLGSYNWMGPEREGEKPTIVVPGIPREWKNDSTQSSYQLSPDQSGTRYVDMNAFYSPTYPTLPLFLTIDATQSVLSLSSSVATAPGAEAGTSTDAPSQPKKIEPDWKNIAFVAERNDLRKLLKWATESDHSREATTATTAALGEGGSSVSKSKGSEFRIDMQLAGEGTVLLSRWEKRATERLTGMTFSKGFEKHNTKWEDGFGESTGHFRIIKYDMDGLPIIVNFEVDAFDPTAARPETSTASGTTTTTGTVTTGVTTTKTATNVDDLSDLLSSGLKISSTTVARPSSSSSPSSPFPSSSISSLGGGGEFKVLQGGRYVPQETLMQLATRSKVTYPNINWPELYAQMWFSQTPFHALGKHVKGLFQPAHVRKVPLPSFVPPSSAATATAELDLDTEPLDMPLDQLTLIRAARKCQDGFWKLKKVLEEVREVVVRESGLSKGVVLSLVGKDGEMKVYRKAAGDDDSRVGGVVPEEVLKRFE